MFTAHSLDYHARRIDLQRHIVRFDSQGRCVEERDLDSDGQSDGRTVYEYPDPQSVRQTDFNYDGKIQSISELKFDGKHRLIEEKTRDVDHGTWSREYRYTDDGGRTDIFSYRNEIPEAHWISFYNDQRRLTWSQLIVTDPAKDQQAYGSCGDCGLSSGQTTFLYDPGGRLKEESSFNPSGQLVGFKSYEYDDHGSVTREHRLERDQPASTFSYDANGNWTKQVTKDPNSVTWQIIEYYSPPRVTASNRH